MTDPHTAQDESTTSSNELDALEIVEAEELQEGVAFHAFRFHA